MPATQTSGHARLALLPAAPVGLPHQSLTEGRAISVKVIDGFHSRPIPEIARLGRTLRAWKDQFLAYFSTARASNGGTEAVNGVIEINRRIARGFPISTTVC
jgi:transposase